MIHEILLILWDNPGNDEEKSSLFELQEFLHPSEKELLRRILDIAANYHWIMTFYRRIHEYRANGNAPELHSAAVALTINPSGLYIKAFANGIYDVLGDYRNEMVKLEESFLQNPQLSLTFILSTLEKFQVLFNMLKSVIEKLQKDNVHGCLIMGVLHKYIRSGVDVVSNSANKIIRSINVIFYRHLCNWIIYGDLVDVLNEFFICDGKCPDENFLYPEQLEELVSSNTSLLTDLHKRHRIKRPPIVHKFYINWEMVPTFISRDTAERILFMGRIVWIIRNDPRKSGGEQYQTKFRKDIWEGKELEYYKKVQALETCAFNPAKFQSAVEECRIKLTKYLWSVMLDEGNLKEHLQLIRDYYALGRGELFTQFIAVAEKHIKDISLDHSSHSLNFIFLETARKIYGDHDKTYMRFELATSKSETTGSNLWSKVQLNFEINWPLHIVFHPKSIQLYNQLFCYLLRLKKTQINLHKLWQLHMSKKQKIDRGVWTLRQHLIFLVNNLQYYLQVDVIEAQFSVLLRAVENAYEFEDIIKVHHEFISNLLAKTFVLTPDESHTYENKHRLHQTPAVKFNVPSKVYNVIVRLLELCDEFCLVATVWGAELTEPEINELEDFQKRTDTVVESLLFVLYSLHEKANGQHLLKLLYQLDFNRYFSKSKPNFNLTVSST